MTGLARPSILFRGVLRKPVSQQAMDAFIKTIKTLKPSVFWEVGKDVGCYSQLARTDCSTCRTVLLETEQEFYCLDGLIARGDPAPDLIKIDTDGTEKRVIEGARNLLEQYSPVLIIKTNQPELIRFLEEMGYRSSTFDQDTIIFISVYF